ncbi:MAG TPA: SCO family protein [Verrucomicrobiae bacterium]|nr:SCO family protein [Verrucomicrobiae bacterium]
MERLLSPALSSVGDGGEGDQPPVFSRIQDLFYKACWRLNVFLFTALVSAFLGVQLSRAGELPACCRQDKSTTDEITSISYTAQSLYQVESKWTTDAGKEIKLGDLAGRPQVVAMFFANCTYACPIIVHDMQRIEAALPAELHSSVGFTLVSFDSQHDTPAALADYRRTRELPVENWTLLHGQPGDVLELAALLGVRYKEGAGGQFMHSNVITLLNAKGEIAFQQTGLNTDPQEMVRRIKQLVK